MKKSISENQQIVNRKQKLNEMIRNGFNFPNHVCPKYKIINLKNNYDSKSKEELEQLDKNFSISGRIITFRLMGKASFIRVKDFSNSIQCYVSTNNIGKDKYVQIKKLDIGDIIWCEGNLFKTKTNELSINIKIFKLINKSLHPLPNKWDGLKDTEIKYRKRYLDLIMSDISKEKFIIRSKVIKNFRLFLDRHDFIEVETPVLNQIAGGATAKPFSTYHNSLSSNLYCNLKQIYLMLH